MIQEAYVSLEIAKLLKEKDFPQDPYICNTAYTLKGKLSNNAKSFAHNADLFKECGVKSQTYSMAPTQQMACAWLREKEYAINVDCMSDSFTYKYYIIHINNTDKHTDFKHYDSYEEATEAALLYALKNLI